MEPELTKEEYQETEKFIYKILDKNKIPLALIGTTEPLDIVTAAGYMLAAVVAHAERLNIDPEKFDPEALFEEAFGYFRVVYPKILDKVLTDEEKANPEGLVFVVPHYQDQEPFLAAQLPDNSVN